MTTEEAPSRAGQAQLLERAVQLAGTGATQEAIAAALAHEYPGKPSDAQYLNPAAEAVMQRIVRERGQRAGLEKDIARLVAEGKPAAWAYTQRGLPVPPALGTVETEPRPAWTDAAGTDWRGPLHTEVQACRNVWELMALCERAGLEFTRDAAGLKLNQRLAVDSDLFQAIRRGKAQILAVLEAQTRPIGDFE